MTSLVVTILFATSIFDDIKKVTNSQDDTVLAHYHDTVQLPSSIFT